MAKCWHCKAESPAAHYERVVHNKTALHAEWTGWRLSGMFLIAPGQAGRITPARLLGMLWREATEKRSAANRLGASARSSQAKKDRAGSCAVFLNMPDDAA